MALTRRQFLESGALVATATAIAGCQSGESGGDGEDGDGDGSGSDGGGSDGSDGGDTTTSGMDTTTTASAGPTETVGMVGSQFDPRNLSVEPGTTVEWVNQDSLPHTVTNASDNWSFDEEASGGESLSYTFEESDVYDVFCRFHGTADLTGMSMKIAVGDATIASPLGGDGGGGGDDGSGSGDDGGGSDDDGGGAAGPY